jgi:integrator complex subunit 4
VLSALGDTSWHVRVAVRNLLKVAPLANITCLHATIQALLSTMQRYPYDTDDTFSCLKFVGERHGNFCEFLLEDLLHIDSRFMTVEPHPDDLNCTITTDHLY